MQKNLSDTPAAGLSARQAALDLLAQVRAGATLDEALDKTRSFAALEGSDRGFSRALATAVLRRQGAIDHVIGIYVDKPLPKRAQKATDVLRLAAAQSIIFDTPDHAVVSTSVSLVKGYRETGGYAGLVNAVARKIAKHGKTSANDLPERVDTPGWMWRAWERQFGPAAARAIAHAHQSEAPIDITPRDPSTLSALAEKLDADVVLDASLRLKSAASVPELPGFEEGQWWVQDAAAAIPARLFGDVNGKRVFDLCAAPGGKTMQLASGGAHVVAVDINGPRLKIVQDNLQRVGLRAVTEKADVLEWSPDEKADAILLDAPCSATGTIRRHPDILRHKSEDEAKSLAHLQSKMIDKAVGLLKPGGVLVYATCSLQGEEGEAQIKAALERHGHLARLPVSADELGGLTQAVNRNGDVRTMPSFLADAGGMDGFFASRLVLEG